MNRNIFLILLLFIIPISVVGQTVTVEAKIDSVQIFIGQQAKIELAISIDSKQNAVFPQFRDTLIRGIEVLETSEPDTQYLNNRERLLIKQEYTITSFDSALYYIPPIPVQVDSQVYKSNALALKVYSMAVNADKPDEYFGLKEVMKPAFAWEDWRGLIILSVLAIPLLILLIYLVIRARDNKPIIRRVKIEPKVPPHVLAMQEIERVKAEKTWQKGEPKEYYTELTDIIRTYISDRFGFSALEMTSSEIIDMLMELKQTEDLNDLKILFQTADLVKFAKHNPLMNENDANLINAIEFINETKDPEEENVKPQPKEITIIEKRSLRTKILLISGIVVLAVSILAIFIYVVSQLYNLL
ncbi:MAG: BatD family protein [Bacteroides sp.]|nr:BatD family protein [Bacteroides sp.]